MAHGSEAAFSAGRMGEVCAPPESGLRPDSPACLLAARLLWRARIAVRRSDTTRGPGLYRAPAQPRGQRGLVTPDADRFRKCEHGSADRRRTIVMSSYAC
jgi:hypothetical protein